MIERFIRNNIDDEPREENQSMEKHPSIELTDEIRRSNFIYRRIGEHNVLCKDFDKKKIQEHLQTEFPFDTFKDIPTSIKIVDIPHIEKKKPKLQSKKGKKIGK